MSQYLKILISLILIIYLPEGMSINLHLDSPTIGALFTWVISAFILIIDFKPKVYFSNVFYKLLLLLFILIFFSILFGNIFNNNFNYIKLFQSIILIILQILLAYIIFFRFVNADENIINLVLKNTAIILLVFSFFILILKILVQSEDKKMIFFNEPSHFAIASGPFYFYYIITSKKNILFLILAVISAILLQNMTLLIPIIIALYITNKKYFILLLVLSVLLLPILSSEFITYLTDRSVGIGNSTDNNNLSGLVYIQGWEYVISIFKNFYGIGIGFQQMGQIKINSNAQDFLHFIDYPLNENDGSFLFSKLIVEFGIIGLIITLYYLFKIPTVYKSLKLSINKQSSIHIFAYSCYLFLSVLLFARNYSYFNPAILLFFASLFIIINTKQIEK